MKNTEKVLFVDDDPNVLSGIQRSLRREFNLETVLGPEAGQEAVAARGPFAVVVADMQMPGMNGIQFLCRVRARAPDTVRMMLTGNAQLDTSIKAVNEGNIFRFLTKPCPSEILGKALEVGIGQYQLIRAEKDLLNKTLAGSIRTLFDVLSIVDPRSFGLAQTLRQQMRGLTKSLGIEGAWKMELAAMFSQLGNVMVPAPIVAKVRSCEPLSEREKEVLAGVPETGGKLLENIPRMEPVAEIVRYQDRHFDGTGPPEDGKVGVEIPLGARMLKVLLDLAEMRNGGRSIPEAFETMRFRTGRYDPEILSAAAAYVSSLPNEPPTRAENRRAVSIDELRTGQTLASDVCLRDGKLLISAGRQLNVLLLDLLRNHASLDGVERPVFVR